jgi:hypothetical protein
MRDTIFKMTVGRDGPDFITRIEYQGWEFTGNASSADKSIDQAVANLHAKFPRFEQDIRHNYGPLAPPRLRAKRR